MRRVAAVVCLGTGLLASSSLSEPPIRPTDDSLWIAAVEGRGNLYPLARLADGSWEVPDWVLPFWVESEELTDAEGVEATTDGDGNLRWPGGPVAVGVPTNWLLYSAVQPGAPLTATGVRLESAHCEFKWALATDSSGIDLPGQGRFAGVALSRPPEAVFLEDDFPGLDKIEEDLGLIDSPPDTWGDSYRKFRWLGFFRVEGAVIGVVHGEYYEGESIRAVEIDGEVGRVLTRTHMGGC